MLEVDGGTGTVVNDGSIAGEGSPRFGPGSIGVHLSSGGSVTNSASAYIGGYEGVGGAGVMTVVNAGRIEGYAVAGVELRGGGSVTNQAGGLIKGAGGVGGDDVTVVNYGRIAVYNYSGIGLRTGVGLASGSVTNAASASIYSKYVGVSVYNGTLTNAGTVIGKSGTPVYLGGTGSNLLVLDPGYGLSGIAMGGTSASNTLELASAASAGTLSGLGTEFVGFQQTTIDAGSTLEVQGTIARGETLMFAGNGAVLDPDAPGCVAGSVTNSAPGETIDLKGVDPTTVSYAGGVLNFSGGSFALSLANPGTVVASPSGDGAALSVLCFCANTRIATPSGESPVQHLAVGDWVTTHGGAARRIVWIGTGKVLATSARRNAATPVIVRRSALADNVLNRELRVTKGHSLYIGGVLIPVEFLVNHSSIRWDDHAQQVELYHLELETHDVLVANGAPAESYRDDGNRWLFGHANSGWDLPPQQPCAPVLTGGPVVDAAWRRLLDRAGPRPGIPTTVDADLHLLVDGRRVDAASRSDAWHVFRLPAPPATARIVSRSGAPQELGLARDPRCLGVALRQIMATRGAQLRTMEAEDPLLADGFHQYEPHANIRWTDGDAAIPPDVFASFAGPIEIALRLGGSTLYPDECIVLQAA